MAFQRLQNHQNPLSVDPVQYHIVMCSLWIKDSAGTLCQVPIYRGIEKCRVRAEHVHLLVRRVVHALDRQEAVEIRGVHVPFAGLVQQRPPQPGFGAHGVTSGKMFKSFE